MKETKEKKRGIPSEIIVAVVIALLAGGTSPWWWREFFPEKENVELEPDVNLLANIWKQGSLKVPVTINDRGQAADLDNACLVTMGTSISASGADIRVRQSIHGIVLEPGLSERDGTTFRAKFTKVSDSAIGLEGSSKAAITPDASNHLQLLSGINEGSFISMVTTEGRLAEFAVSKTELAGRSKHITIEFTVWNR